MVSSITIGGQSYSYSDSSIILHVQPHKKHKASGIKQNKKEHTIFRQNISMVQRLSPRASQRPVLNTCLPLECAGFEQSRPDM